MNQLLSRDLSWHGPLLAGTLMLIMGFSQMALGLVVIVQDAVLVVIPGYLYDIGLAMWGWVHLTLGALAAVTGLVVFTGSQWARGGGIVIAVLSGVATFCFAPFYPLWSVVIIAFNVLVVWTLAMMPQRRTPDEDEVAEPDTGHDWPRHSRLSGGHIPTSPREGSINPSSWSGRAGDG